MKRYFSGALALIALACVANSAHAVFRFDPRAALQTPHGGSASIGSRVVSPFGAIVFCQSRPTQCAVRGASGFATSGGKIVLTDHVMAMLRSVNTSVNASIRPVSDRGGANADNWQVGGGSGDCEDFALAKRAALLRGGFPSSATLVATGETRQGRAHAVLIVRTDRGDFVLDSKASRVVPFSAALYSWESIQSPQNPRIWRRL